MLNALTQHIKRLCIAACGAIICASSLSAPALATEDGSFSDFLVQYDQVEVMRLQEDAATLIVGNPSIADVSIQSSRLLVITGKTFGVTNLVILNHAGQLVMNRRIVVRADDQKIVNLNRGTLRETYNCAPKCQSVLTIGDEANYYSRIASASTTKFGVAGDAGESSSGGE